MSESKMFMIETGPRLIDKIFFRVAHPMFPTALFLPFAVLLVALVMIYAKVSGMVAFSGILAGIFAWTFIEYLLHRFVFHWNPASEPWKTLTSSLHLAHHRDPQNPFLVFPPMLASMIIAGLVFFVFLSITWSFSFSVLMISGVSVGYIVYEWFHYGAHNFNPKSKIGKYMRQYHLYHHFKRPKKNYGVTNPLWDRIFGTHS